MGEFHIPELYGQRADGSYDAELAAKFIALEAWLDALSPEAFLEAEARIMALIEGES